MPVIVGVDEAGYGPKIGPMVVAATVWDVPPHPSAGELDYLEKLLWPYVCRPSRHGGKTRPLYVDDSKKIYRSRADLATLEKGALCLLYLAGFQGEDLRSLAEFVDPVCLRHFDQLPWLTEKKLCLPHVADAETIWDLVDSVGRHMERQEVKLKRIACSVIFEPEFNQSLRRYINKGEVHARAISDLLNEVLPLTGPETYVYSDRHGGRIYYRRFVMMLPEASGNALWIPRLELPEISRYESRSSTAYWRLDFVRHGEQILAVAAASVIAKYIREMVMVAFNAFWTQRVPDLLPTAGYPADAKRFKQQITPWQAELGIPDEWLWRNK